MRHRLLTACVLSVVAACSSISDADPSAPARFSKSLGGGPATFVLDHADRQTTDPITLFDHVCQSVRYQTMLHDTLMLWSDGRARRAFAIDELTDGTKRSTDYLSYSGRWTDFTQPNAYYFSDGPSIQVSFAPDLVGHGTAYVLNLRVVANDALATLGALGGSCPGSANDGHEATLTFTRR